MRWRYDEHRKMRALHVTNITSCFGATIAVNEDEDDAEEEEEEGGGLLITSSSSVPCRSSSLPSDTQSPSCSSTS